MLRTKIKKVLLSSGKMKKTLIVLGIALVLFIIFSRTPYGLKLQARFTAFIYIQKHYGNKELHYKSTKYISVQNHYVVTYKEKDGDLVFFHVGTKYAPYVIDYDSLDSP